jgi:hypothetical protein
MPEIEIVNTLGTGTTNVDVLFVTNKAGVPEKISELLEKKNIQWSRITVEKFVSDFDELDITGTVIIDTSDISKKEKQTLLDELRELESEDVATILLNDFIDFPFDDFELVRLLDSATFEEMWGRIEANVTFRQKVASTKSENDLDIVITDDDTVLTEDTANQLKMAGEVQRNFLPKQLPDSDIVKWATIFRPAEWVSGDIYDIARLDEQHIGFYIADAVGHSMPAALLTMFLKQAIVMRKTTGNDYRIFGPLEVISSLNKKMVAQDLAGCLFATCCYGLLNTRTLQMTFARAGHPYPVLIRDGKAEQLENTGGLLGVFAESKYEQRTVQLQSGDKLFMYSDGCESAVGDCDNDGKFNFTSEFDSLLNEPVDVMLKRFEIIVRNRQLDPAEIDDVTAVSLEIQ